ncbi:MAG: cyclic nucleotide-binding domain-containing protein [Deltaproteobacteria bacterium]|nr:cyclic nucleotide-binding domain-containing protein [Deltaproteobacteria bacterium]
MPDKSDSRKVYTSNDSGRILEAARNVPLFAGLDAGALETLSKYLYCHRVSKDDVVFREGETGDYVCFVAEGILEVKKNVPGKRPVVIARVSRGQAIGEMSTIDEFPRSASVTAVTDTTLVTLGRKDFDALLADHPRIGIRILEGLTRLLSLNLRRTSSRLADYMLPLV